VSRAVPVRFDLRPLDNSMSLEELRAGLFREYTTCLRDSDKAGELDTAAYWEGCAEAYRIVLSWITSDEGEPTAHAHTSRDA